MASRLRGPPPAAHRGQTPNGLRDAFVALPARRHSPRASSPRPAMPIDDYCRLAREFVMQFGIWIVFAVVWGVVASNVSKRSGGNPVTGFVWGFVLGLIGLG